MSSLRSESIKGLAEALVKAQYAMEDAVKGKTNPHFKSKYADLASIREAARKPLHDNGLCVVQLTRTAPPGSVEIETMLLHQSGEYIASTLQLPVGQATAQAYGSAITYARRYGYAAILGIASDDDDGNEASKPSNAQRADELKASLSGAAQLVAAKVGFAPKAAGGPLVFPNFGRDKGQPIKGASHDSLMFYRGAAEKTLADSSKEKFHAKERAFVAAIDAELAQADKYEGSPAGEPPPLTDADAPTPF